MQRLVLIALAIVATASSAFAHCEIPCGIYGDQMRIATIHEHLDTVEKSMKQITELSQKGSNTPVDNNQLIRWVSNKETHATEIQHIVTQYFMTQRIKPSEEDRAAYAKKLQLLHEMLFYAMKTKQTTDTAHVEKMRSLVSEFYEA
jgi:nickel superoxide dismutase